MFLTANLAQLITLKMAKLGPVNNSTACIYIYIYIYTHGDAPEFWAEKKAHLYAEHEGEMGLTIFVKPKVYVVRWKAKRAFGTEGPALRQSWHLNWLYSFYWLSIRLMWSDERLKSFYFWNLVWTYVQSCFCKDESLLLPTKSSPCQYSEIDCPG